jgi:3-hydroxybutyryl-CoA dehydratase
MEELHGLRYEDLSIGMTAVFSKTVTEADVSAFAGVSGDTNPIHLDAEYAKRSRFGARIAHGMLTASLISTVIGTRLPGPGCVYVSQSLRFRKPVRIGDTVVARVTVREMDDAKRRAVLSTVCTVGEEAVLDGEAIILIPRRDAAVAAE